MLRTLPPTDWSQISEEIPSLFVIMSHKEWDGGEGRREEKGGGSQTSVIEVGLHGHEPSVGISSLSAEFFREGCFDFHIVIFFVGLVIYMDGKWGESEGEDSRELEGDGVVGGAGRSKYCIWVRSPGGVTDCEWGPLEEVGGSRNGE